MSVFWNEDERRLRAAWRLLAQTAMMVAFALVPILAIAEPLTKLHRRGAFLASLSAESYDRVINMIVGPFLSLAVIASVYVAVRWIDRRTLSSVGVVFDRVAWLGFAAGIGLGGGVMACVFALEYALGYLTVQGTLVSNVADVSLRLAFSFALVKALCVGLYEELVSRGYHLRNLSDGLTPFWGVAISSAIFSLLHLTNENSGVLSTIGLLVNALFFAAAFLLTGRLSTSIGAHIAWNLVQGAVFGFPVSGHKESASLIGIAQSGPVAITGGDFGPEGGLAGILASVAGIAVLMASTSVLRRARTPTAGRAPDPSGR